MFKHLLLPTDGSETSELASRRALELAREGQARITALHVIQPFHLLATSVDMIEDTRSTYEAHVQSQAQTYLGRLSRAAREVDVPCQTVTVQAEHPYEAIIRVAEEQGCDLIVMGSHGRRGLQAVLIGSETQKVLTHCKLPVLVLR